MKKNQSAPLKHGCFPLLLLLAFCWQAQAQFTYTTNDNEITVTGYLGGTTINIPDSIDGYPVTDIGNNAFAYAWPLSTITLPASLKHIGAGAFSFCYLLTEVTIPAGTTSIGDLAFFNSALINVTIPDSVVTIGYAAFNSTHLTNIILPANLTIIEAEQFNGCNYLESANIPAGVTSIGNSAFGSCYSLTSITFPNGLTNIGTSAFVEDGLTNVFIPASVLSIGDQAFKSCRNLPAINVDPLNPVYGSQDGVLFDKALSTLIMFPQGRTGRYRIPNGVTNIWTDAFNFGGEIQLPSPDRIIVPSSVTDLGYGAFSHCPQLTALYFLGNPPANLGGDTFYRTDNLTVYYLPGSTGWTETFDGRPTALWNPQAQTGASTFGVNTNQFGFTITGTANIPVAIEAGTNIIGPWVTLQSLRLTNGSVYFSDPQWTNFSSRFYRLSGP